MIASLTLALAVLSQAPTTTEAPTTNSPTTNSPSSTTPNSTTPKKALLQVGVRRFHSENTRVARVVTDAFVDELRKLQGVSVVALDDVEALLDHEAQKQLAGCSQESCLSEIAEALGVDALVTGSLTVVDDSVAVDLRRLHPGEGRAVAAFTERFVAAGGEESLAAVGPAVQRLFPELPLQAGQQRGVDKKVGLLLQPPPLDPWMTLTVGGIGVAALVTTGVAGAVNLTLASTLGEGGIKDGATVRAQQDQLAQSGITAIAAGSVTAVSAIALIFAAGLTDWTGARETAANLGP